MKLDLLKTLGILSGVIGIILVVLLLFSGYSYASYTKADTGISQNRLAVMTIALEEKHDTNDTEKDKVLVNTFDGTKVAFIIIGICLLAVLVISVILIVWFVIRILKKIRLRKDD
jgi:predicted ATP-dependent serine protease